MYLLLPTQHHLIWWQQGYHFSGQWFSPATSLFRSLAGNCKGWKLSWHFRGKKEELTMQEVPLERLDEERSDSTTEGLKLFGAVWIYLHFRWHPLSIVSLVSSRWRRSVWDSCPFPGPSFQLKLQKLLEELFSPTGWTFHYTVAIMEFPNTWQSKEQFVLYFVHNFCLWSCLVGLHRPFDALLRTETHPAMSQSLCWVSVSPMLSPADWHLPAGMVKVQSQILTSPFTHPCL